MVDSDEFLNYSIQSLVKKVQKKEEKDAYADSLAEIQREKARRLAADANILLNGTLNNPTDPRWNRRSTILNNYMTAEQAGVSPEQLQRYKDATKPNALGYIGTIGGGLADGIAGGLIPNDWYERDRLDGVAKTSNIVGSLIGLGIPTGKMLKFLKVAGKGVLGIKAADTIVDATKVADVVADVAKPVNTASKVGKGLNTAGKIANKFDPIRAAKNLTYIYNGVRNIPGAKVSQTPSILDDQSAISRWKQTNIRVDPNQLEMPQRQY